MSGIKNCKLLIIGLDGVSFDLLDPWFRQGELPHLQRLKAEGCAGNLMSVPNLHSAAAWTSMVTGKNPGKHGIYFFVERDAELNYRFFKGGDRKSQAVWNILNDNGKTTGIVNVPMTFPAEPVAGVMISGMDAPSIKNKRSIHPPHLDKNYAVLKEKYDIIPPVQDLIQKEKPDVAVQKWLEIISARLELCQKLCADYCFDFFMVTFLASDWANHNLWKYTDSSYPLFSADKEKRFGHLMLEIYRSLDSAVGKLLELASPETNIMIVSDHGAGKHQLGSYYLTDWMVRNGYMTIHRQPVWRNLSEHTAPLSRALAKKLIPRNILETLKGKFPKMQKSLREKKREQLGQNIFKTIDWTRTKAYTEFKAHNIWINLMGREKLGVVNPGKEYDELCSDLKTKLLEWRDETSDQAVVDKVFHKSEIYHGPYSDRAPDLQIRWNEDVVLTPTRKSLFGKKIQKQIGEGWSGDHRMNGILIAMGPQFKKGVWVEQLSIYDIAPTALSLFGAPLQKDFDGKIIKEILLN